MKLFDQFVVKMLPLVPKPVVARLSKPYIAGDNLDAAVECVKSLNDQGFRATLDVLGEFVTNMDQAEKSLNDYLDVVAAIQQHNLDANVSVKPTFFGLLLDKEKCQGYLDRLLKDVVACGNFMRLDMEDTPCTTMTIDMYHRFRETYGYQHVGVVLQAYLRRTVGDVEAITAADKSNFRLCKGIYVEPERLAYQGYDEVRDNFIQSLDTMFAAGAYVGIATHDEYLVEKAEALIAKHGLTKDQYEFQMLLGVREKLRDQLKDKGHHVRIYVPFGQDWYGYSVRRLKENPSLAGTMFKAILLRE